MPTYDFEGRVAFVTGAARAQGRAIAEAYAEHGADVVVTDICENIESNPYDLGTRDDLDGTAEAIRAAGRDALAVEMDVRDEAAVEAAVRDGLDEFGRIDFLANNAGIFNASPLTEMTEATWDDMVGTALKGVWLCSKHVGRHFVERGDGGKITTTSSIFALGAAPGLGHNAAAKWGVRGLTKTLALELAEHDVNVNCVCPTAVDTPMLDGFVEAYGEEALRGTAELTGPWNVFDPEALLEPTDVSEAYMWLSSDPARYVTGVELPVDAGFTIK